jgi:hypothetical protein
VKKLDKRQAPLVVILSLLAAGLFGFFVYQMITPSKAAAHMQPSEEGLRQVRSIAQAVVAPVLAPPPSAGMRDPFIPGITDPAVLMAYRKTLQAAKPSSPGGARPIPIPAAWNSAISMPHVTPLPAAYPTFGGNSHGSLAAAPIAPVDYDLQAPSWTLTGIVESGGGEIAIMRNGDSRRMVRRGEMVDGQFRVVDVEANRVVLASGKARFNLPLGGEKKAPPVQSQATPGATAAPSNTPPSLATPAVSGATAPSTSNAGPSAATPLRLPGEPNTSSTGTPNQ